MRKTKKTAAGKSVAGKPMSEVPNEALVNRLERAAFSGESLPQNVLLACVKAFAAETDCAPERWLNWARTLTTEHAKACECQQEWSEALEPYKVIDGFYCVTNTPSIQAIAMDDNGALFHYDGEEKPKPVTLPEALQLLEQMNIAAGMFNVEPLNEDGTFTSQARWFGLLAKALKGGAR